MKTLKSAEELFKYYATEPIELTDEYGLDYEQFIKALAEDRQQIKDLIDEMIKEEQVKEFEIAAVPMFEIHCKVEALTEIKAKL